MGWIGSTMVAAAFIAQLSLPALALASQGGAPPTAAKAEAGSLVQGRLPNGLRFSVMRRTATPGEVDVRLAIRAGSMNEESGDEGIAHLLEHMAFRGSAALEDGALMRTLQSLGARPGPDANAATGPVMTTYMFDLPHGDRSAVETGLTLLREIAGSLTLSQDKLDVERGVVLAEGRDRSGSQADLAEAVRAFEVGDHPLGRPTIGRPEVIAQATALQVRRFYDAYYRPDRAILVVVGDVDPRTVQRQIETLFASWRGRGDPGRDPPPVVPAGGATDARVTTIAGLTRSGIFEVWPQPPALAEAGQRDARRDALAEVADAVVEGRLAASKGAAYGEAKIERVDVAGLARAIVLAARSTRNAREALAATLSTVQQLKTFGVPQPELDSAIAARRAELVRRAEAGPTQANRTVASDLLSSAVNLRPYLTPAQRLEAFDAAVSGLTPQTLSTMLAADYASSPARVMYFGPMAPGVTPQDLVNEVAASTSRAPAPFTAPLRAGWVRPQFGPPGTVATRRRLPDLDVTFVRFANGVELTVKPAPFLSQQAIVEVRFGHGRLDLPRDRSGPEALAATFLTFGGVRDMTRRQMEDSLQGKAPPIEVAEAEDAFRIRTVRNVPVERSQLPILLDVMAEQFSQPGWREEGWRASEAAARLAARRGEDSAAEVLRRNAPLLLHSGDERFAPIDGGPADRASELAARKFLEDVMRRSPPEVVVVGDVDVDEVVSFVAGNFGALDLSATAPPPPDVQGLRFPPGTRTPVVLRHHGRPDEAAIEVSWPTTGRAGHLHEFATALVLADVLKSRLTEDLRQLGGKVYSPEVFASFSPSIPGYGRIAVNATLKPGDVGAAYDALDRIAGDLAARPASADEFERAQRPRAQAMAKLLRRDDVWAEELGGAQDDPRRLDFVRTAERELSLVTPADVQKAARAWLVRERSWRLSVLPDVQAVGDRSASAEVALIGPAAGGAGRLPALLH